MRLIKQLLVAGLLGLCTLSGPAMAQDKAAPTVIETGDGDISTRAQSNKQTITDMWRDVEAGVPGYVPGQPAARGVLIQNEGELWRTVRNGIISPGAGLALAAIILGLIGFYVWRGPIKLSHGPSDQVILRFNTLERVGHWLTAGSFLVLMVTGLTILWGRYILVPVMGLEANSWITVIFKWLHNSFGFTFIAGLLLIAVLWAKDNLWDRYDWQWIKDGGGILKKGVHPKAAKFNFGQKIVFWQVLLVGAAVAFTGVNMLFPYQMFDLFGMQVMVIVHLVLAVYMMMFILAHIYIGTVGMEGASSAVTHGYVDLGWAEDHHAVWVEEEKARMAQNKAPPETIMPASSLK